MGKRFCKGVILFVDIVVPKGINIKIASLLVFLCGVGWPVTSQSIALEDRVVLEQFFERLITREGLGYVLLGEKPAILVSFIPHLSWKHPLRSLLCLKTYFSPANQNMKEGWKCWEKYLSRSSPKFIFIKTKSPNSPLVSFGFILNRDLCTQVIRENRVCFEKVINDNLSLEISFRALPSQVLGHEELLGILLGYGKRNSQLYSERQLNQLAFFPKSEDVKPPIALPSFRADWTNHETALLRERYLDCREKIGTLFLHPRLLDQILKILLIE